jgi:hypothetical protein
MTVAELRDQHATTEEVIEWRREQLLRAGYARVNARILAELRYVDLHEAVDLVRQGCPESLALAILL